MDEKQFPEQDESQSSFEETPDISIQQEPDTIPEPIAPDEEFPDEIFSIPGDQDTAVEFSSSIQDSPTDEHPPEPVSFMDRIPDVNDPEESPRQDEGDFSQPVLGEEITPDEGAMDFHGMLGHGEEEPPFDMDLLNDPELSESQSPDESASSDQEYRDNGQDLDAVPDSQAKESEAEHRERPVRKGRPKRKKGEGLLGIPNILVTFVWLALILAIGVTAGRMLWVCAADVLAFGREDQVVTITIYESDTMDDIVEKLYSNGLIRYRSLFQLYASISDAEEDIQPGIYDLNTRYDYHALVNSMSPSSSRSVVQLTIPEGYTCRQIFDLLEENRVCTAVDIGAYASDGELDDYWFLENVERGSEYCLEGFLFPDTYQFYKNSTPREALEKMLDNFEVRFNEEMRAQIETLNANVTGGGYTVREVVIVASLIEREAAAPSEAAAIAGVIYNRLFRWGDTPAYLNIDAALVYAQGGDNQTIDTTLDSPYNTYTHVGLTPTPIANPGLSSLEAALNPETHDYYYYVLNPSTGMHQFSTTYEEHEAYRAQFAAEAS
ncbi:MAG TPA: endolytic transglycosylase MltG [Candidatus Faecousia intestinavium]|nr:endolytic transglycosylase MltG [Candidatus Faecousia intestinavium]